MRRTKRELRAELRTEGEAVGASAQDLIWLEDKDLENLDPDSGLCRLDVQLLGTFSLGVWASYPIQLSLLLISVKVYRGHGSLGNNYLGQLVPSAWNDFLV